MLYAGGSFGRRANPACRLRARGGRRSRKALAGAGKRDVPVKLVWTREDDMTRRLLPARVLPHAEGRARRGRQRRRLAAPHRRPVDRSPARAFEAMMVKDGVDVHVGRGRVEPALRDPATSRSTCTRRRSACRCCGGARSARRTPPTRPRRSSTSSRRPPARIRSRSAARCSRKHPRHLAVLELAAKKAGWGTPLAAGQGGREARPRRRRARVVQHRRRAGRRGHRARPTTRSPSTASSAPSTAASRSIPTTCARRWKAASASACRRRCTARSR